MAHPTTEAPSNPIDAVEDLLQHHNLSFERIDEDALLTEISTNTLAYPIQFLWKADAQTLMFLCNYTFKVPASAKQRLYELMAIINDNLYTGNFSWAEKEGILCFRNSLVLEEVNGANLQQVRSIIEIGIATCERFQPAFGLCIENEASAEQAFSMAVHFADIAGHA